MRQKAKGLADLNILIALVLLLVGCQVAFEKIDITTGKNAAASSDSDPNPILLPEAPPDLPEKADPKSPDVPPGQSPQKLPAQAPSPVGFIMFHFRYADAGNFALQAGDAITLTWAGAPEGALRYDFTITPFNLEAPIPLGTDTNDRDGVEIEWVVPRYLGASLRGAAYYPDGRVVYSNWVGGVYSGDVPPAGVCSLSVANIGTLTLFRKPDIDSESFAHLTPVAYARVYNHTEEGWYQIDATVAFDSITGEAAVGTGWVHEAQGVDLHGTCDGSVG